MTFKTNAIILAHAMVGWALCGATMGLGLAFTNLSTALVVHLVAAPVFFIGIAWVCFRRFNFTSPLQTATAFMVIVILLDVFVVALLIERSFAMFGSVTGTWLVFLLIFLATYLTGRLVVGKPAS